MQLLLEIGYKLNISVESRLQTAAIPWQNLESIAQHTRCHSVSAKWLSSNQNQFFIHRSDEILPRVSGNKLYKLFGNLYLAKAKNQAVTSMGGVWSNHLHALSSACEALSISCCGLVRDTRRFEDQPMTAMLSECVDSGMKLEWLSRSDYRLVRDHWFQNGQARINNFLTERNIVLQGLFIPEGGSSDLGLKGVYHWGRGLADQVLDKNIEQLFIPCGTGATFAGLVAGISSVMAEREASNLPVKKISINGVAALKTNQNNDNFLQADIERYFNALEQAEMFSQSNSVSWQLLTEYFDKGFGQASPTLIETMLVSEQEMNVLFEPVYTAKALSAIKQLVRQGKFKGQRIMLVHTGGLQGRRGWDLKPSLSDVEYDLIDQPNGDMGLRKFLELFNG